MSYQLILTELSLASETTRDAGEDVFLADLPVEYKVYAFYYAGAMRNKAMEDGPKGSTKLG